MLKANVVQSCTTGEAGNAVLVTVTDEVQKTTPYKKNQISKMVRNLTLKPKVKQGFRPGDRVLYWGTEFPPYLNQILVIRQIRTDWDKPYCDAWTANGLLTTWLNLEDLQPIRSLPTPVP